MDREREARAICAEHDPGSDIERDCLFRERVRLAPKSGPCTQHAPDSDDEVSCLTRERAARASCAEHDPGTDIERDCLNRERASSNVNDN